MTRLRSAARVAAITRRTTLADGSVAGFTQDKFAAVRAAFEANLESGADVGACFCATQDGETVVDLWGGFADAAKTKAWERDTIVNVYSTTRLLSSHPEIYRTHPCPRPDARHHLIPVRRRNLRWASL